MISLREREMFPKVSGSECKLNNLVSVNVEITFFSMLGVRESRNRIIRDLFHSRAELSEGRNIFPGAFRVSNPFETLPTSCSCFGNVIKDENLTSTFKNKTRTSRIPA
jgi:hypothetical protein